MLPDFTNRLSNLSKIAKLVVGSKVKFKRDPTTSSLLAPLHCYLGH